MFVDVNEYNYVDEEKELKKGYIVSLSQYYKGYKTKEEMLDQLILDLENEKSKLIDDRYKRVLKKKY